MDSVTGRTSESMRPRGPCDEEEGEEGAEPEKSREEPFLSTAPKGEENLRRLSSLASWAVREGASPPREEVAASGGEDGVVGVATAGEAWRREVVGVVRVGVCEMRRALLPGVEDARPGRGLAVGVEGEEMDRVEGETALRGVGILP